MKKFFVLVLFAVLVCGGLFGFDAMSFPDAVPQGSILINGSFDLGTSKVTVLGTSKSPVMIGGTFSLDYALPTSFPLTLGAEIGVESASEDISYGRSSVTINLLTIPIMARIGWHPNFEVENLDVYLMAKIGGAFGVVSSDPSGIKDYVDNPGGFAIGFDIGCRYFFTPAFGLYGEFGWTGYLMHGDIKDSNSSYDATGNKILSLGITVKPK